MQRRKKDVRAYRWQEEGRETNKHRLKIDNIYSGSLSSTLLIYKLVYRIPRFISAMQRCDGILVFHDTGHLKKSAPVAFGICRKYHHHRDMCL